MERIKASLFHAGKPRLSVFNWIRLFFFFSFSAVGVLLPYLGLLLFEKGISGVQLGSLLGLIPLVQIFVQPLWGYLADVLKIRRFVLGFSLIALSMPAIGLLFANQFSSLLIMIILYAIVYTPYIPISSALILEYLESIHRQGEFGRLRLWGSVGYVLASLLSGIFLVEDHLFILPYLFGGLMILSGLIALILPDFKSRERMDWLEGVKLLPEHPQLLVFFIGMGLVGGVISISSQYLPVYLGSINTAGWIMGSVIALQAFTEIPLMSRSNSIVKRVGLQTAIILGTLILPIRFVLYSLIENPVWFLPVQLLHGVTILSMMVFGPLYVSQSLPAKWRATGQGLYTTFYGGFGSSIGLFMAGVLNDWRGIQTVWISCMIASVISIVIIRKVLSPQKGSGREG